MFLCNPPVWIPDGKFFYYFPKNVPSPFRKFVEDFLMEHFLKFLRKMFHPEKHFLKVGKRTYFKSFLKYVPPVKQREHFYPKVILSGSRHRMEHISNYFCKMFHPVSYSRWKYSYISLKVCSSRPRLADRTEYFKFQMVHFSRFIRKMYHLEQL